MKPNPYLYASGALLYIAAVASFLSFIETIKHDTPDTLLDGMAFISLVVLSAAIMAFFFFYQPVLLAIEGNASGALSFFLKTLGTFAVLIVLMLTAVTFL